MQRCRAGAKIERWRGVEEVQRFRGSEVQRCRGADANAIAEAEAQVQWCRGAEEQVQTRQMSKGQRCPNV